MQYNFDKIPGTLVYVQVQEPVKAFVKPGAPAKPDEWKASVVVTDEDYVDAFEEYARELDTMVSVKKVKAVEFKDKYKTDVPEGAGKNVWVITLRKSTELGKTGKPVPDLYKPKVFQKLGNKIVDITHSKLAGNGSIGVISIDRFDRKTGGSSLYLKNVLVTTLVEYEKPDSAGGYESGSEFDDGTAEFDGGSVKVPAKAMQKVTKQRSPIEDDEFDSELSPF